MARLNPLPYVITPFSLDRDRLPSSLSLLSLQSLARGASSALDGFLSGAEVSRLPSRPPSYGLLYQPSRRLLQSLYCLYRKVSLLSSPPLLGLRLRRTPVAASLFKTSIPTLLHRHALAVSGPRRRSIPSLRGPRGARASTEPSPRKSVRPCGPRARLRWPPSEERGRGLGGSSGRRKRLPVPTASSRDSILCKSRTTFGRSITSASSAKPSTLSMSRFSLISSFRPIACEATAS